MNTFLFETQEFDFTREQRNAFFSSLNYLIERAPELRVGRHIDERVPDNLGLCSRRRKFRHPDRDAFRVAKRLDERNHRVGHPDHPEHGFSKQHILNIMLKMLEAVF